MVFFVCSARLCLLSKLSLPTRPARSGAVGEERFIYVASLPLVRSPLKLSGLSN